MTGGVVTKSTESSIPLLEALLAEQQSTAVDRFARWHDKSNPGHASVFQSAQASSLNHDSFSSVTARKTPYRELIPLSAPLAGQQYAFEVDLDACTGCKSCVAACHSLNGLEEDETWRSVGVMVGGTQALPVIQHVTTACHHCLEPACLQGCPVNAYEKDLVTGIVKHLDDQCIGCQYCIFKCPYDVPRYSHSKGIVRKCDMCQDRLAVGEAPACVQSCPNQAIRITIVSRQVIIEESETGLFLPGAPDSSYTLPTTVYRTEKVLPRNLLPADYFTVNRSHSHWPLILMLVFTQMSVGAFAVEMFSHDATIGVNEPLSSNRLVQVIGSLVIGGVGLTAAVGHLGRPLYAFRALLGLRTSWMSREILAFGLFPLFSVVYAFFLYQTSKPELISSYLALLSGGAGIACSAMIYIDTHRPTWRAIDTWPRFLLTTLLLGLISSLVLNLISGIASAKDALSVAQTSIVLNNGKLLCECIIFTTIVKLLFEVSILFHLWDRQYSAKRRSAMLLINELWSVMLSRLLLGVLGGVVLPLLLVTDASANAFQNSFAVMSIIFMLPILVIGELLERYLFFAAAVTPKMPGGLS